MPQVSEHPSIPLTNDRERKPVRSRIPAETIWQSIHPRRQANLDRRVGVVIGEDAIQLAVIRNVCLNQRLLDARKVYIPSSLSGVERETFIANELQAYVNQYGGRHPRIILGITGPETAFRAVYLPRLSHRDMHSAMQYQARKQLPFPIETANYDFRVIARQNEAESPQMRISLLAGTQRLIIEHLATVARAGLRVEQVLHTQDAIGPMLADIEELGEDDVHVLICIERDRTDISYYKGTELEFTHSAGLGSSFLANRAGPTVFDYFSESLATEIQNSLDFYGGQYSSQLGNHVLVYGDLAFSDDLIDRLSDKFGFRFRRFPTEQLHLAQDHSDELTMTLPVCLPAVAVASNTRPLADLLPADEKSQRRELAWHRRGMAWLSLMVAAIAVAWFLQRSAVLAERSNLLGQQQQIEDFRHSPAFDSYNILKQRLAIDQSYLEKIKQSPSYLGLNLKQLSRLTPSSIRLTSLSFDGRRTDDNLELSGKVRHPSVPPEIVLAEYVERLSGSPFYTDVKVERYVKKRKGGGFELEFRIRARAII